MPGGTAIQGNSIISHDFTPTSMNWHGSVPTGHVDNNFEPNFRQFDFFLENKEVPDSALVERVFKVPEGESSWSLRNFGHSNIRSVPVVASSFFGAAFVNFLYTRLLNKTGSSIRWSFVKCYAAVLVYKNITTFIARERYFQRDFQRNQIYSADELRDQRDRQRVREALYEKQFVNNAVAEYRVKAWQVADRFA